MRTALSVGVKNARRHFSSVRNPSDMLDVVVIGAGHAGLSMSYYLKATHKTHVVLERNTIGSFWSENTWDKFRCVTPNWHIMLPGLHYEDMQAKKKEKFYGNSYAKKDQLIEYFKYYAKEHDLPVMENHEVQDVLGNQNGVNGPFLVRTKQADFLCKDVVVCTGPYQRPYRPNVASQLPASVKQLHSSEYKNVKSLPEGGVLVVGSGQSGCQIIEELRKSKKHPLYWALSECPRLPRTHKGNDCMWWLDLMQAFFGMPDKQTGMSRQELRNIEGSPSISGNAGGYTVDPRGVGRKGVTLLGQLQDIKKTIDVTEEEEEDDTENWEDTTHGKCYWDMDKWDSSKRVRLANEEKPEKVKRTKYHDVLHFNDNVEELLDFSDRSEHMFKEALATWLEVNGRQYEVPPEFQPGAWKPSEIITEMTLDKTKIKTIIWATGYQTNLKFPFLTSLNDWNSAANAEGLFDDMGYPVAERGVSTQVDGLHFLGLRWQHNAGSALMIGIEDEVTHVLKAIEEFRDHPKTGWLEKDVDDEETKDGMDDAEVEKELDKELEQRARQEDKKKKKKEKKSAEGQFGRNNLMGYNNPDVDRIRPVEDFFAESDKRTFGKKLRFQPARKGRRDVRPLELAEDGEILDEHGREGIESEEDELEYDEDYRRRFKSLRRR